MLGIRSCMNPLWLCNKYAFMVKLGSWTAHNFLRARHPILSKWCLNSDKSVNRQSSFSQNRDSSCKDKHWRICEVWSTITILNAGWKCFWKLTCRRFCAFLGSFVSILGFYAFGEKYCVVCTYKRVIAHHLCHREQSPAQLFPPPLYALPASLGQSDSHVSPAKWHADSWSPGVTRSCLNARNRNGPTDWGGGNKEKD